MDNKSIPGLTRTEADAVTAIGAFLIGMLVLLCTVVLTLHFLSGLPAVMIYGILFALIVFSVVCLGAFMRAGVTTKHTGPPQLEFRSLKKPAKGKRPAAGRPQQKLKPLA